MYSTVIGRAWSLSNGKPFKDDPVAFHCSKSKSQVAAVVSYVFILSDMANRASFLVLVCCKLLYGDNIFTYIYVT